MVGGGQASAPRSARLRGAFPGRSFAPPVRGSRVVAAEREIAMQMRGLYAIVDTGALEQRAMAVIPFAEAVLDAKPAALQLRDKGGGARRTLALLRDLRPLADRAGVPLFANDRPDLAVLACCDGVHLGQDDLPVDAARALIQRAGGALRVGLSTHDAPQLAQ